MDPNVEIWQAELLHWPMTLSDLTDESLRIIHSFRDCAALDIRSKVLFRPPTELPANVVNLAAQEGKKWRDG
jgi:hypothetical protein